jgi:glycosyltransferase involved in cell wall biosynthesis
MGINPMFEELGVNVVSLGGQAITASSRATSMITGIYNKSASDRLSLWIKEFDRPDWVYHVHGWSKILSPQIFLALKSVASRVVVHAHDFFLICPNGAQFNYRTTQVCYLNPLSAACLITHCDKRGYADKVWRSSRQAYLNHALRSANITKGMGKILLIHEKMVPFFIAAGFSDEQLQVIRNPVTPFSNIRITVERNSFAYFIGRVVTDKGIHDAIHAAQQAQVPLRVIGDGPQLEEMRQKYPQVEFFGWRTHDEIKHLIQEARFVVMPSLYPEPFGLIAIEAAQSGVPVVLSELAFLAEEIVQANVGMSCDTQNITEFAACMHRFVKISAADMKAMSDRAHSAALGMASTPQNWRDLLLNCYDQKIAAATHLF